MFRRLKQHKSTVVSAGQDAVIAEYDPDAVGIDSGFGVSVNPSCNSTIIINCLQELYNAVGVVPSAANNSIAVTGYTVRLLKPRSN
jgi:tripeptidyl-peptidase I